MKKGLGAWSLFRATSALSVYLVWPPYFVFYRGVLKKTPHGEEGLLAVWSMK